MGPNRPGGPGKQLRSRPWTCVRVKSHPCKRLPQDLLNYLRSR
jgi:hypothetical protein